MAGSLTERVIAVCDDALRHLQPGEGRTVVEQVRLGLYQPLRIAIAGSVSAGKSTLVNAFLGQRIAAVDAGECTRVVTTFDYDHHERIEVVLRDGRRQPLAFLAGRQLPSDLGVPVDEVARVDVFLSNERLAGVTIIDTPGLNTVTADNEARAADLLGVEDSNVARDSKVAMSEVDALIFLMPHIRQADAEVLTRFRSLFGGTGLSAANAVGVLSKVDKLVSDDEDPWPVAQRIATRARDELRSVVADVVPIIGLLAETANTDQFTEADAAALRQLSTLDELDREDLLLSPSDFLDQPCDVPREARARLLRLLDLYGVAMALRAIDQGAVGAHALIGWLRALAGFDPLRALIDDLFTRRADLLKAHAAVATLRRVSFFEGDAVNRERLRALRTPVEELTLHPDFHELRLLEVVHAVSSGELGLDPVSSGALDQLTRYAHPARRVGLDEAARSDEIAQAAASWALHWAPLVEDRRRSPDHRRMVRDVKQAYELIYQASLT